MGLVNCVQVPVRKTVDHVPKCKKEEEDEYSFPKHKSFENRYISNQQQSRYRKYRNFRDSEFNPANSKHVNEEFHLENIYPAQMSLCILPKCPAAVKQCMVVGNNDVSCPPVVGVTVFRISHSLS